MAGRNKPRCRTSLFEILDDVVALDVHSAVMDQHRHQSTRIDAEKPWLHIFVARQIDGMRLPLNLLEVKEYAKFLRTGRADTVENGQAFPPQHRAGTKFAVCESTQ